MKGTLYICSWKENDSGNVAGFYTFTKAEALKWARSCDPDPADRVEVDAWELDGPPREVVARACALAQIGDGVESGAESAATPNTAWTLLGTYRRTARGMTWEPSGNPPHDKPD